MHWEEKGKVFTDPRGGVWAPDVFHHSKGDGKFYLFWFDKEGVIHVKTTRGTDEPAP